MPRGVSNQQEVKQETKRRPQDIIISVHVKPEQRDLFKRAAEEAGMSVSRFIVRSVEEKMESKDLQAQNEALRQQVQELRVRLEEAQAENARLWEQAPPTKPSREVHLRLDSLESTMAAIAGLVADLRDQLAARDRLIDRLLDAKSPRSLPARPEAVTHRNRTYRMPDPRQLEPQDYGDAINRARALANLANAANGDRDLNEALRRLADPEPMKDDEILSYVEDIRRQAGL